MDLPKNITQIGESDQRCKVYVEDYVISYIKQMNRQAENRGVAVALYGTRKEENDVSYVFFYGAARVHSIQKGVRHLSQAQNQEIEKLRRRYFSEYQLLGYQLLNGEMVEGFYVCEQDTCRYINGYACFYEKNDVMLAYMLDSRKEEAVPESVDQEKYQMVRQRQEERRAQYRAAARGGEDTPKEAQQPEGGQIKAFTGQTGNRREKAAQFRSTLSSPQKAGKTGGSLKMMRAAAVGLFVVLCILGITTLSDSYNMEDIQTAARQLIAEFTEQKIPDSDTQKDTTGQVNTLVAEDKLSEAIRQENDAQKETEQQSTVDPAPETGSSETQESPSSEASPESGQTTGTNPPLPHSSLRSRNSRAPLPRNPLQSLLMQNNPKNPQKRPVIRL